MIFKTLCIKELVSSIILKFLFTGEEYDKRDYQSSADSRLRNVLFILKSILDKYPPLHSPDTLYATANIIGKLKSYNYFEEQDGPVDYRAAIDQLALSFSTR